MGYLDQPRCKHGMIEETCGVCQKIEWHKPVKFPVEKTDEDGNTERIFIRTVSKQTRYRRFR